MEVDHVKAVHADGHPFVDDHDSACSLDDLEINK